LFVGLKAAAVVAAIAAVAVDNSTVIAVFVVTRIMTTSLIV
jgi:hypothetical protein